MAFLQKYRSFPGTLDGRVGSVRFFYAGQGDPNLRELRKRYNLEEVSGKGDELQCIVRLMTWVYRRNGCLRAASGTLAAEECEAPTRGVKRRIDCYWKNVLFSEACLAMGHPSRLTHLLPHFDEERQSHFVTSVYSRTLGKWLMMDPESGVYVTDERGVPLGVSEVRRRLAANRPLKTVQVEKNWLKKTLMQLTEYLEGEDYFWFLSEIIFKVRCPQYSLGGWRSGSPSAYFELLPEGYEENPLTRARLKKQGKKICYLHDETLFWQSPLRDDAPGGVPALGPRTSLSAERIVL